MSTTNIILLVVMLAVFYALMILPQRRNQKKRQTMMSQLGPGAKIVTTAGIYGKIVSMDSDKVVLQVADDVSIEMDPRAVLRVVEPAVSAVGPQPE